jgi:hypothetical protein
MIISDPESFLEYYIRQQNKSQHHALMLSDIPILKRLSLVVTTNNSTTFYMVRLQILMVASMKITAFWYVVPYSPIEIDRHQFL